MRNLENYYIQDKAIQSSLNWSDFFEKQLACKAISSGLSSTSTGVKTLEHFYPNNDDFQASTADHRFSTQIIDGVTIVRSSLSLYFVLFTQK